ncbi:MAG: beta-ketoacyl-[acyl-carrier-protein] synthase family protein [Methylococcales symbiont of Hymedesmia sp. n. MRB-2018]|nr:MAG: beta-ketoacyl-[acyl-carrier-protein] synthase family protein [Methylococcales symbiont of Hymedesmia sp. n. MRB-2018]
MTLFLNDLGTLSAAGNSKKDAFNRIITGDRTGLLKTAKYSYAEPVYVGVVQADLPLIDSKYNEYACRNNQLLLAAYSQIEDTVKQMLKKFGAHRIGIVLGTSTSGIRKTELALSSISQHGKKPDDFHYKQQQLGGGADFLAHYLDLKGPAYTISTACSSSGRAFVSAQRLMALDLCDAVIVGGADSLCRFTVNGFEALESISTELCKPFGKHRNGINISEGVALFVLSKEQGPVELSGIGASSDAYHFSAPEPTGQPAVVAMKMALKKAGKVATDIDYINLHGTATPLNDAMESKAVSEVFSNQTAMSSSKGILGHALGASSALELGICWQLLSSTTESKMLLPPNINDDELDPKLPDLNFIQPGQKSTSSVNACLSNSFAFGGNNISIVVERT